MEITLYQSFIGNFIQNFHFYLFGFIGFLLILLNYIGTNPYFEFGKENSKQEKIFENFHFLIYFLFIFFYPKYNFGNFKIKNKYLKNIIFIEIILLLAIIIIILSNRLNFFILKIPIYYIIEIMMINITILILILYILSIFIGIKYSLYDDEKYKINKHKKYEDVYILNDKDNKLTIKNNEGKLFYISKDKIKEIKKIEEIAEEEFLKKLKKLTEEEFLKIKKLTLKEFRKIKK